MSSPVSNKTIEAKVVAAAAATFAASVLLAYLNAVMANSTVLGGLPPQLQFFLLAVIPTIVTFLSGWVKASNRV